MARIIGDWTGTTYGDFLIHPGWPVGGERFTPDDVDTSTDIAGVRLQLPYMASHMRSVVDEESALAAGQLGMMAVAPRGLTIELEARIVRDVKENEVRKGQIESVADPTTLDVSKTLGDAVSIAEKTGHSHIPVISKRYDLCGMFHYSPLQQRMMNPRTPISEVMHPYRTGKEINMDEVCTADMSNESIRRYLKKNDLRFVPVVDDVGRLDRLVFIQRYDAYNVGAAVDTHPGWEERAAAMIEAGADMIFVDTMDSDKPFADIDVVARYNENWPHSNPDRRPICVGNIVSGEAFRRAVEYGADVVKVNVGPGSICKSNQAIGIGAPPMSSLIRVGKARDAYARRHHRYVPVIIDGGMETASDMNIAMTIADALMGGKPFGCFLESAGQRRGRDGNTYDKGEIDENNIVAVRIYGEGSREAALTSGDMKRYDAPTSQRGTATIHGVSGWVDYQGRFKPGVGRYEAALREAMYHAGARTLPLYRKMAVLERVSERAKMTAAPHGIQVISE